MHAKRWLAAAGLAVMLLGLRPVTAAAPGDFLKNVPATHEAFGFLDVAQARATTLFQELRPLVIDQSTSQGLAMIEQLTGLRLPDDLAALAVSGSIGPKKRGALYAQGKFDRARIEGFLKANPQYTEIARGGDKILGFLDEKKGTMTYVLFLADNLAVMGPLPAIDEVLATARGKAPSLAANPTIQARLGELGGNPILLGIAVRPAEAPPELARLPVELNIQSVVAALFAEADMLRLVARIEAGTVDLANQYRDIVEGVAALARIQKQVPRAAELANRVTVAQKEKVVEATARVETAKVTAFLRQQILTRRGVQP